MQYTIVILIEGNRPHPRCPQCDMFLSCKAFNIQHMAPDFFQWGEERKRRRLVEEEARAGDETALAADEIPLAQVTSFKYLWRILTVADDDLPEVIRNLRKARRKWTWLTRFMDRKREDVRTSGQIYLAVV